MQVPASKWSQGGGRSNGKKPDIRVDENLPASPFDKVDSSGVGRTDALPTRQFQPPPEMGPNAVGGPMPGTPMPGMGPYAGAASGGAWSGKLGSVPNHYGYAGLKPSTKEWTLRILGTFPGMRFSSGFRTPQQNAAANGHPNSGHMRGDKIDLSGSPQQLQAAANWAKQYGAKTLIHNAGSGTHLDISWAGVR